MRAMTRQPVRSPGRPTLDAVAARAGVGRGTASRVLNGSPQVSPQAKAAVEAAILELGYVPNRAARSLVTQRTDSVALVVSESQERVFGEPFFAGVLRGINSALMETPLQLWLAMAATAEQRQRVEHHLTDQHVDGVLLLSLHDDDPLPAMLRERGMPFVLGGRPARAVEPATSRRRGQRGRRPPGGRVPAGAAAPAGSPRWPGRRTWRSAGPGWPATARRSTAPS